MRSLLGAIALSLVPVVAHAADAPRATIQIARGEVASKLNELFLDASSKGFGGAVIVSVKGAPLLKAGYGFANREKRIDFTPATIAQIGSITKPMTAVAILQLAEAGKVDLKARVRVYLSNAPEPTASATIHQLLTHTARLADFCGDDFDVLMKAEFIRRCLAMPLAHPGGYHYSNMGYSTLAAIVEQVSGQSWEQYLRDNVWRPLGMNCTGFVAFECDRPVFANGYLANKPQGVISERIAKLNGGDWNLRGNGGIQSPATNMERFYRAITGSLPGLSPSVRAGLTTPKEQEEPGVFATYGLALRMGKDGKPFRIGHAGSDGTFFSYIGMLPNQDVFIYLVGNNGGDNVRPLVSASLRMLIEAFVPADQRP
jgi:CubicO group peptidase (beta-lactamase class C family)